MAVTAQAALNLYNFTLQRATQVTHVVHGNVTGTKQQVRDCRRAAPRGPTAPLSADADGGGRLPGRS